MKLIKGKKKEPKFSRYELSLKFLKMGAGSKSQTKSVYCLCRGLILSYYDKKKEDVTTERVKTWLSCFYLWRDKAENLKVKEFMQLFPVTKDFNGHKYGAKDYFSVMEMVNKLDVDKTFKEQNIDLGSFLFEYTNEYTDKIMIDLMRAVDDVLVAMGEDDMFTAFCKEQGKKPPTKMYMHENDLGKAYMITEDGKSFPVKKAKPRYLKVVQ